jgi:hypothetical protein
VRPILGGSIAGIVHGVSTPVSGLCPVQLANPSDAGDVRDETVTDPAGYYTFPNTAVPIDLLTAVVPASDFDSRGSAGITTSWGAMLINGVFTRVCLMTEGAQAGECVSMTRSKAGRIYRAYCIADNVKADHYTIGSRGWSEAVTVNAGHHPCIVALDAKPLSTGKRGREVQCYYVRDGQIRRRVTVDECATWKAEEDSGVMATRPFVLFDSDTSMLYRTYYDAGSIKFQKSKDWGTTWDTASTVVNAIDDFMAMQIAYEPDGAGKRTRALILSYATAPGTIAVKKSFDDGHTWG